MPVIRPFLVLASMTVLLGAAVPAWAQGFEVLGTRAAGMGGAFVAVADDASAVYWNPAGLASGAFFSLVIDRNGDELGTEDELRGGTRSATLLGLSMPALGLSYYRLRSSSLRPVVAIPGDQSGFDPVRLESLITHHAGATLVQSLTDRLAVGATLKLVRGVAAAGILAGGDRDELLDEAGGLVGAAHNAFDADIGIMAVAGAFRAGLTLRNVAEPEFETPDGAERLRLERQSRAGVALATAGGVLLAADVDLERVAGPLGDTRDLALGAEARLLTKAFVRGGFRFNTIGGQPDGRRPSGSVGGSYAVFGSLLVDGQLTMGSDAGARGWGLAARVLF